MESAQIKNQEELIAELDKLRKENEQLSSQIHNINESVKNLGYSTRLFAETYLTNNEKRTIAKEFDRAGNAEQVEKIYYKYYNQMAPEGAEIDKEYLWSREFTRELERFFYHHKGFNPFESINEAVRVIRFQFKIEDDIRSTDNPEELKKLKEAWASNRDVALGAIEEILSITNEILRK